MGAGSGELAGGWRSGHGLRGCCHLSGSWPLAFSQYRAPIAGLPVQPPNAVVVIVVSDCMWNAKTRSQFVIVLFSALQAGATVYFQPLLLLPFRVYPVFWLGESLLGPAVCHILVYSIMRNFRNSGIA